MLWIAIQTDVVQNWLVGIATKKLSKSLGTEVRIQHVSLYWLNKANLNGVLIRDKQKDTILYAGAMKVRFTDWFILKDSLELKYIGLEDAVIKLQRTDSIWNFGYIADYIKDTTPSDPNKKGLKIDIRKIDFKNVSFLKNDYWRGERMTGKLESLNIEVDSMNLKKSAFYIGDIIIEKPYFAIENIKANRPEIIPAASNLSPKTKDTSALCIQVNHLKIANGIFKVNSNDRQPLPFFDGGHLLFTKLNANFDNLRLKHDVLTAKINISTHERSGIILKKLNADFTFGPSIMEFAHLQLQTNKSSLGPYYAMHFKNFDDDFAEYVTNVKMKADFRKSKVSSDDIAFFSPELKTWKKEVELTGILNGTVADFNITNLLAKDAENTSISGSLAMKGLPNIDNTNIQFSDGLITTNYKNLVAIIPDLKQIHSPDLLQLGNITYQGNYKGTIKNFVANGTMNTSIGSIAANIAMQFPNKGEPSYSGAISTSNFQLGNFLHTSQLGIVAFDGKILGSSFALSKLKTQLEGNFKRFDFNDYSYSNISVNGNFQKKFFNGEINVNDSNIVLKGQVEVDLTKAKPSFNMLTNVSKSNFKTLKFLQTDLQVTGLLDLNFTGTNIDNFLGTARMLNGSITSDGTSVNLDSLILSSEYKDSTRYLHFATKEVSANVQGNFKILDLQNCVQSFLNKYYPSYINPPTKLIQNQNFTYDVQLHYIEPYLKLLHLDLKGLNDVNLSGKINTNQNLFQLKVLVPFAQLKKNSISGAEINCIGNSDSLIIKGNLSDVQIGDSLHFPSSTFSISSKNDHSLVSLITSANSTLNQANLNADVVTFPEGVTINLKPSSFILNEKKWNLEQQGEITLSKQYVSAKNVKFIQGFQEITVSTEEVDGGNTSDLKVNLKNVVLGDLTSLFIKNPSFEGITNGDILLTDFFGKFKAQSDLKIEQFRMDADSLGLVNVQAGLDSKTGMLKFNVQSPNQGYNLDLDGIYNLKDSTNKPLNTSIKLNNSKIDIVQKFIGNIFSNLSGKATGILHINGNLSEPDLLGDVVLKDAGLKVNYTQVYYHIDSANINFNADGINFHQFEIKDTLGNTAIVEGSLLEKGFKDLAFDFDMHTNKLLLINTKPLDNQAFYGNAIGDATLSFKGPETNCKLTIVAEANGASHIFIPNSISKQSEDADFIVFKPVGDAMVEEEKQSKFNLLVDLDLTANNKVDIDVILDEATGDIIKAKGYGRLKIRAGTSDKLDIRGRYNIEEGSYNFNFQSLVRKPFELRRGDANYIEWSGDAYDANVHIDAMYTATNIKVSDLISSQSGTFNSSSQNYKGDVYVIASLTGKLSKPDIKFHLEFPSSSPIKSDNNFTTFINLIETNENEMLKQVTYLVAFNSFAPYGEGNGVGVGGNFSLIGSVNTISAILIKEINKVVSNFLYKLTGDKSLLFDLKTNVYNSSDIISNDPSTSSTSSVRSSVKFKLGKSFFKDNLIVTFGGDVDFNLVSAAQSGNFQWLPDLNVEIVLTSDKKLRAILFSKNSLDITGTNIGRRNRQGFGISYKKDYNENIFERSNKQKENTPKPLPLAPNKEINKSK